MLGRVAVPLREARRHTLGRPVGENVTVSVRQLLSGSALTALAALLVASPAPPASAGAAAPYRSTGAPAPVSTAGAATPVSTAGVPAAPARVGGVVASGQNLDVAALTDPSARSTCLAGVEKATGPLLVMVGASFAAGVGAGSPSAAWSVDLARMLGWRAVIAGVPGIGYSHIGQGSIGPLSRVVSLLEVSRLHPTLLVVQAGHDDWRTPLPQERARVEGLFAALHREAPATVLAAMTVFSRPRSPTPAATALDRTIVTAAKTADRSALIMDPLTGRWRFARQKPGHLHPSALGDRQIALRAFRGIELSGMRPSSSAGGYPAICDLLAAPPLRR